MDKDFPEVDEEFLSSDNWRLLWKQPMFFREPVHNIEARSVLSAIRHASKDRSRHGKHLLVLNDNMSVVLAVQKGRCSNYGLLRILRRFLHTVWAQGLGRTLGGFHWNGMPPTMTVAPGRGSKEKRAVKVFSREEVQRQQTRLNREPSAGRVSGVKRKREESPTRGTTKTSHVGLTRLIRNHKKKRQRALERKKKFATRLRATRGSSACSKHRAFENHSAKTMRGGWRCSTPL